MSRYADVEWLKTEFDEANEISFFYLNADSRGAFEELKKIVEQAPTIDICFCRECKYTDGEPPIADGRSWCVLHGSFMYYCSDGSRSEKPNNCETCRFELYCPEMCEGCCEWDSHYEPKERGSE